MKKSAPVRFLSTFILLLIFIMTVVFMGTISLTYRVSKNLDANKEVLAKLKSQLEESQGKWDPLIAGREKKYDFIDSWHEQDKKDFESLFNNRTELKNEIYKEYIALNIKLNELDKKAYNDPKGYILYNPLLTEAHNVLTLAINARARVLTDSPYDDSLDKNKLANYYFNQENYYDYLYQSNLPVSPTINFMDYDEEKFVEAINVLPLPNNYFHRLRLFFVDRDSPLAGGANLIDYRENNDIVIFGNNLSIDNNIGVLVHEIGHVVEREILYKYKQYNEGYVINQEDKTAMLEYAQIYGKNEYYTQYDINISNEWEWNETLGENFAEDFAHIYSRDYSKRSNWVGEHKNEVKAFIEDKINQPANPEPAQFNKGTILFSDGNHGFEAALRADEFNIFYTKNNKARVQFEKFNKNSPSLEAYMMSPNQDLLFKESEINGNDELELYFPKKGKYLVYVISEDPNSSLDMVHYSLSITYEP